MKKTYVVNGAAHPGFGETTARLLISNGNKVIGLYEQEDDANAKKMKEEFSADCLELLCIDCNNLESLKQNISTIPGPINGFVNAYFGFDMENVDDFDCTLSERLFRINYHTPVLLAVELKKIMERGSSIVIVTSTESERGSFGGISYAASKAAMHNLIKSSIPIVISPLFYLHLNQNSLI